jgi:hypothetical protein
MRVQMRRRFTRLTNVFRQKIETTVTRRRSISSGTIGFAFKDIVALIHDAEMKAAARKRGAVITVPQSN